MLSSKLRGQHYKNLGKKHRSGACWCFIQHCWLQAHDWQAYQELLAKQKGPEGASERYEVINRFLDDTEDYLHKLAGKVANVKLSQEASEAAAQAMAEARAQVTPTSARSQSSLSITCL